MLSAIDLGAILFIEVVMMFMSGFFSSLMVYKNLEKLGISMTILFILAWTTINIALPMPISCIPLWINVTVSLAAFAAGIITLRKR